MHAYNINVVFIIIYIHESIQYSLNTQHLLLNWREIWRKLASFVNFPWYSFHKCKSTMIFEGILSLTTANYILVVMFYSHILFLFLVHSTFTETFLECSLNGCFPLWIECHFSIKCFVLTFYIIIVLFQ